MDYLHVSGHMKNNTAKHGIHFSSEAKTISLSPWGKSWEKIRNCFDFQDCDSEVIWQLQMNSIEQLQMKSDRVEQKKAREIKRQLEINTAKTDQHLVTDKQVSWTAAVIDKYQIRLTDSSRWTESEWNS